MYSIWKKSFSKLRDFSSKKSYLRHLKDMDKFNRIPNYKLNKATNLYSDENGFGEFDKSELQDFIKRKNDQKLDELDLARRKLKFEKDIINSRLQANSTPFEDAIRATEQYLNKEAAATIAPEHPEYAKANPIKFENDFNSEREYGDYSKYFAVNKLVEPGNRSINKQMTAVSDMKRLDYVKDKYNAKNIKFQSNLLERDRRLADRINKDLQSDDLSFSYADFLKQDERNANIVDSLMEANYKSKKLSLSKSVNDLKKFGVPSAYIKNLYKKYWDPKMKILNLSKDFEAPTEIENGSIVPYKYKYAFDYLLKMEHNEMADMQQNKVKTLSLPAQEDLYNYYLDGASLNELSLKYGLLPKTVKRIICEKYVYWNMIFPKIGPIKHKRLLEEAEKSKKVEYVDYGADLEEMAYYETCVPLKIFEYKKVEPKNVKEVADFFTREEQKKKKDRIPIKFVGDYYKGHLIYDEFVRKGKAGARPSNMFYRYLLYKDKKPGYLPDKVYKKISLGPRVAVFGYNQRVFY